MSEELIPQIEEPEQTMHPTFYVATEISEEATYEVQDPRVLNFALRGDKLWVEPADVCGVHYVFDFAEFEAVVSAFALQEGKVLAPEENVQALHDQITDLEVKLDQAVARRDDSELRVRAVLEWAEENDLEDDLAETLSGIVTQTTGG
jgi:hypothetical protein